MGEAASFIATQSRILWLQNSDSHENIIQYYKQQYCLDDTKEGLNFVRITVAPLGNNLSLPLKQWEFMVAKGIFPQWFNAHEIEVAARIELKNWAKAKLSLIRLKEAFSPVHPFKIQPRRMSEKRLRIILHEWNSVWNSVGNLWWGSVRSSVGSSVGNSVGNSVRDSVWNSVGNSVWDSVGNSVRDSVEDSVWNSVEDSVWNSVWAYSGSLYPGIKVWAYIADNPEPWQSLRTLWRAGYVPSFDGKTWRLHAHADARIVLEWTPSLKNRSPNVRT